MQSFLTRFASRGACRCPQCLHTASGVTRKAGLNSAQTAPRYWTSSTLWLSGTFATAATFDAVIKQNRRKQWDAAIADIKQELTEPGRASLPLTQSTEAEDPNNRDVEDLDQELDIFRFVQVDGQAVPRSDVQAETAPYYHHLPPQSIHADDQRKAAAIQRRWTPKKMEVMMLSMDMMQLAILYDINVRGDVEEAAAAVPEDYANLIQLPQDELKSMQQSKLRQIKDVQMNMTAELSAVYERELGDVPLTNYTRDVRCNHHKVSTELNRTLQELFESHLAKSISRPSLLARIAYNLSISTAAPNIETYNTLLIGFAACHPYLVKPTIRSLTTTRVRPNEVTDETILRFYTRTREKLLFNKYLRTMRGKHGGQYLARPDVISSEVGQSRLIRDAAPNKVIQLTYPTASVFDAVVKGLAKFHSIDSALAVCAEMESDGWPVSVKNFLPLLTKCLESTRWDDILAVWQHVKVAQARQMETTDVIDHVANSKLYPLMLLLCEKHQQSETFNVIRQEALECNALPPETSEHETIHQNEAIGVLHDEAAPDPPPEHSTLGCVVMAEKEPDDSKVVKAMTDTSRWGTNSSRYSSGSSPREMLRAESRSMSSARHTTFPDAWMTSSSAWQNEARPS